MSTKTSSKIQAAVLSVALLLPAGSTFAMTRHHKRHTTTYATAHHRHKYSRTRGTAVGAVAGALIDHKHPLTGALIGAAAGNAVQVIRDKKQ